MQFAKDLVDLLRQRILVVHEQPTLTRTFNFAGHFECLLLLQFLGIALELLPRRGLLKFLPLSPLQTHRSTSRGLLALKLLGHTPTRFALN